MAVLVQLDYQNNVMIGYSPNIKVSVTGDATNWTITYEFGSHSGNIGSPRTRETDFSTFKWPTTFYNEIPYATEGSGVILVDCFKVDTFIGTAAFPFTVKANVSGIAPTISVPTITDTSIATMYTGNNKKFIRYISTPQVSVTAFSWSAAYMRKVVATNGAYFAMATYSGEDKRVDFKETIGGIENTKFTITATDSRDLKTSISYEIAEEDLIPYVHLTCSIGNELPDTDGKIRLTCSGNCYTGEFAAGVANSLTVQCRYKEKDGTFGAWQNMTISSASNNKYKAYISLTVPDYRKAYVFECQAQDTFAVTKSAEYTAQALPLFHWSENDFVFEVPVTFNAGLSVPSDESEPAMSGEWTPTLTTSAAVSSYSTRRGWYVKVGNVVTVGFNIAVSCKSGYNSTAIAISGLPFKPAVNAFGGGVMFGAYVNAGFCFEAWAAATNGNITPRLQPCNNTAAGNLQIASTAYYPSGTASMTLGGTITYITN
jgi:hypothetical protein